MMVKIMDKTLKIIDRLVLIIASILFIALAFALAILPIAKSKSFYNHEHLKNKIEENLELNSFNGQNNYPDYDVTWDDVKNATEHIINYLYHKDVESMQFQLVIDEEGNTFDFFSEQALIHMADVKVLFLGGIKLTFICLAIFILAVIYLVVRRNHVKDYWFKTYVIIFSVFLVITIGLAIFTITNFDFAFGEVFHHLIFPDIEKVELSFFSPQDTLTNVLTEEFFMHIAAIIVSIFVITIMMPIIIYGVVKLIYYKINKKTQTNH